MKHALCRLPALLAVCFLFAVVGSSQGQPPGKGKPGDKAPPAKGKAAEPDDDKDEGPPKQIPPPQAKGFQLGKFIAGQIGKGVTGQDLAAAINKERARLGLKDNDPEEAPAPAPSKKK